MVAIVTGAGTGLDRSSLTPLGAQGQLGNAQVGDEGVGVLVNAANGNLVVQRTDQILTGVGLDDITTDTYNSLWGIGSNPASGYGASNGWQTNDSRQVWGLSGTVGTSGSTIKRTDADGSVETYSWVSGDTYVCEQAGNADDQLTYSSTANTWTFTDGNAGTVEVYDGANSGRIMSSTDANGNTLTYTYTGSQLTKITAANGEYVLLTYTASNLTQLTDYVYVSGTLTAKPQVTYTYDSQNRLSTVTTPTSAGNSVVTTYGYSGTTDLITSISQTGGARLTIAYNASSQVSSITQTLASGVTTTTTFTYNSGSTTITDANGNATKLSFDANGDLTQVQSPTSQITSYTYNGNGDVLTATDPLGKVTTYTYDTNNNLLTATDPLGNVTTYTYDSKNNVLTATLTPGSGQPGTAFTTRYVYDANENLRFTITGDGNVTQDIYNASGEQTSAISYMGDLYSLSGLTSSQSPSLSTMTTWASGLTDLANTQRTDTAYDVRGNVSTVTTYSACSSTGAGLTTSPYTVVNYIYDPSGRLLSEQTNGIANSTVYTYDGLGRVLTATNLNGGTTTYQYTDSTNTTVTTSPLGATTTSVYNLAGELLSTTQSGTGVTTGTATYAYDDLGNLCMVTDADGDKSYFLYDADGRKVADIAADGSITRTIYTADNQVAATVSYANKLSSTQLASLVNTSGQPTDPALSTVLPASSSGDSWTWNIYDADNRKIETINGDGDVTVFAYDDNSNLIATTSYANTLSASALSGFETTPPTTLQLPTASAGKDDVTRNFYNNEGQLIATLDGTGYLTQNFYDGAGQLIKTLASVNQAASSLWASGTLAQLQTSVGTSSRDIASYNVYDGQGNLRYTLNTNLQVTEYDYNNAGRATTTIAYAGSIAAQSSYTVATVQSAITTAGLASNTANRTSWNIYDTSTGNLDFTIDAAGDVTQYVYNALGQVTKQTQFATKDPQTSLPTLATMTSWASGQASNTANRITRNIYNAAGQLAYTAQVYNAAGNSYVTGYQYDAAGRTTYATQFAASYAVTDTTTQSALQTTIGSSPPGMAQTQYVYNSDGQLTDTYNALGIDTHLTYDALGRVVSSTVAYGLSDASTTQFTYDTADNVLSETQGYGTSAAATSSSTYDGQGNVLTSTDPNGNVTNYTYDALGNVLTTTDATGAVTTNTYDAFNNVLTSTNALGGESYFFYDDLDRLTLQIDPMGYATATTYGFGSEIASVTHYFTAYTGTITPGTAPTITTSSQDATTSFTRDVLGRVTQETDADGNTQGFAYNAFGNQSSSTNALGGTTTYTYDNRGLMLSETLPETSTTASGTVEATSVTNTYTYDARGNRTQMVEASGLTEQRTTTYTYDTLNRLTSVSGDAVQAFAPNLTSATVTPTTTYTYDDRGDVILTTDPTGAQTFTYYDAVGHKIVQIDADAINSVGTYSAWTYDANGNVTASTVYGTLVALPTVAGGAPPSAPGGGSRQTTYTYDKDNRLLTSTVANVFGGVYATFVFGTGYLAWTFNSVTTNTYDALGDLVQQTDPNHNSVYTYYDKSGRKIAQVDQNNFLTTYTLDANGNVLTETQYATALSATPVIGTVPTPPASNANDRITTFTYDKNGNRLTETRANVTAYSINGFTGVLTAATGSSTITYTYNGLGEVTRETQATGDYTAYTYDSMGRQTQILLAPYYGAGWVLMQPATNEYYDGLNDLTRTSQYDALNSATPARVTEYTYGAGGRLATMTDASGFERYYSYDADGRTMAVAYVRVTSNGTSLFECDNYQYDAMGHVIQQGTGTFNWSTLTWSFNDQYQTAYDAYGDVTSQSVNGVVQTVNAYDNTGHLVSTSTDGVDTFYMYDADGNQTLAISSNGGALPSGYSWSTLTQTQAINLLTGNGTTFVAQSDPDSMGFVVTFTTYDGRSQALQTIEPWRQLNGTGTSTITQSNAYDAFGDVTASTDADGYTTNYTYSTLGSLTQQILPSVNYTSQKGAVAAANPTTTYYYDISGRQIGTMDANGNLTTQWLLANTGYNGSNAVAVNTFDPDGGVTGDGYDVFGDMVQSTNQIGDVTNYTYDAMGRVLSEQDPVRPGGSAGNPSGSAFGQTIYYAYDGLGQRIKTWNIELGSANTATTDYDAEGRIISQVDMAGHATTNSYVWNGSAVTGGLGTFGGWTDTTVNSSGLTQTQTQNAAGQTIAKTDFGFNVYSFGYDHDGRLTSQTTATTAQTNSYYNTGLLAGANSNSVTYTFDSFGNTIAAPGGTPSSTTDDLAQTYTYDAQGNRLSETTTQTETTTVAYGSSSIWTAAATIASENATATYDALNRMTSLTEASGSMAYTETIAGTPSSGSLTYSPSQSVAWQYDLNGNVVNQQATYQTVSNNGTVSSGTSTQSEWFSYDSMNRVTTSNGEFVGSAGSGYIDRGINGTNYTYNAAGQRISSAITLETQSGSTYDWTEQRTLYTYTADGYLAQVNLALGAVSTSSSSTYVEPAAATGSGYVQASYTLDQMGRVLSQSETNTTGAAAGAVVYSKTATYDNDSNVTSDQVTDVESGGTYVTDDTYGYSDVVSGAYDGGALTTETSASYKNGSYQSTSSTQNSYWWVGNGTLQQTWAQYTPNTSNPGTIWSTAYEYDTSGHLMAATILDGTPRIVFYTTNIAGQILSSDTYGPATGSEMYGSAAKTAPDSFYDFFNDVQEGVVTNNGTEDESYSASITQQTVKPGTGLFTDGATAGTPYAAFGTQLEQINGLGNQTQTAPSYTVQDGDTLQSIAQEIWGDSSYWYLLADANGMDGSATLVSGQTLTIPQVVGASQNNATTNTVYNAAQAQGNTSPTHPPKPQSQNGGCGGIGEILEFVVAVVVTALIPGVGEAIDGVLSGALEGLGVGAETAGVIGAVAGGATVGAISDIAAQGVGLAAGIQSQFNWGEVGLSAISAGVGAGLGVSGAFDALGIGGSGFGDAFAHGVLSNTLSQGIGVATGLQKNIDWAGVAGSGIGAGLGAVVPSLNLGSGVSLNIGGMAGAIASAAIRTASNGSDFTDNLGRYLPQAIGQTIGNAVAGQIDQPEDFSAQFQQASANAWQQIENPQITSTVDPSELVTSVPSFNYDAGADANNIAEASNIVSSGTSSGNGSPLVQYNSITSPYTFAPELSAMQVALSPVTLQASSGLPTDLVPDGSGHYFSPSNLNAGQFDYDPASGTYQPYIEEVVVTAPRAVPLQLSLSDAFISSANAAERNGYNAERSAKTAEYTGNTFTGLEAFTGALMAARTSPNNAVLGIENLGKITLPVGIGLTAWEQASQAQAEIDQGINPAGAVVVHATNGAVIVGAAAGGSMATNAIISAVFVGAAEGGAEGSVAGPVGLVAGVVVGGAAAYVAGKYLPTAKWWSEKL